MWYLNSINILVMIVIELIAFIVVLRWWMRAPGPGVKWLLFGVLSAWVARLLMGLGWLIFTIQFYLDASSGFVEWGQLVFALSRIAAFASVLLLPYALWLLRNQWRDRQSMLECSS